MTDINESLNNIFNSLNINHIFNIDDQYSINELDKALEILQNMRNQGIAIDMEITIPNYEDEDIWKKRTKDLLSSLSEEDLSSLLGRIIHYDESEYTLTILQNIFNGIDVKFQKHYLSLKQWNNIKENIDSYNGGKLFLFDQDFSQEDIKTKGISLIEDLIEKYSSRDIFCGILTNAIEIEDQQEEWVNLFQDNSIDHSKFIVISKRNLNDDPINFIVMLKLTLLNNKLKDIKLYLSDIIKSAQANAISQLDTINVYDFEKIVFHKSYNEGIWEIDTIYRIFQIYERKEVMKNLKINENIHLLTSQVRNVLNIPTIEEDNNAGKILKRLETYDLEDINFMHLPIELGDIFKDNQKNKYYILVSQPCDLMIRSDGKRKIKEGIMLEILPELKENDKKDITYYELSNFFENNNPGFVLFRKSHAVRLFILDLCCYNKEGKMEMYTNSICPNIVTESWKKHFIKIKEYIENKLSLYNKYNQQPQEIKKHIIPRSSNDNIFIGSIANKKLSYPCNRIMRLCNSHSVDLLIKYSHYIARSAFNVDLDDKK